ncbi:Nuclear import receptor [Agyrium rufum]|nr:Nuclear import receptor [Agyrium rufum]
MAAVASDAFTPVLTALATMQSNADRAQKSQAHKFLEEFQKSTEAWATTHSILTANQTIVEAKLFAATTLKGKIIYDLDQIPRESLPSLRDSLLTLLTTFKDGPRPIRTQLCVCLANLAIQMTEWKDVLQMVGSTLGSSAGDCVLEFLRVLPEEVTEGRKINLSEEDLQTRTQELLENNASQVQQLLLNYSQSSATAATNPHLMDCISSWLREIPSADIVNSPLLDTVINAISVEASFESAVECLCTIYRDTREVDESLEAIQLLYPRIVALRPKIRDAAESEDTDTYKGITRLFAEAGEAWVVLIARLPKEFRGLVEAILETCARDKDRDSISLTFGFWYELKQMITLNQYSAAKHEYIDVCSKLVDIMIKHLEFPTPEGGNESDLFDGDREQEEKFREFRHQMGDVLKDCCEIISTTECLSKAFERIKAWAAQYASQATETSVPHWQELEAPLFSMRAMGRMVSPEESVVLHQVIPLIVQIPNHEKLRFQAIMALARYTEWTSQHPEFLQPQLNFVMAGFTHPSKEVVRAAALAFRFFGNDCRKLLQDHVTGLHNFYEGVLDTLPSGSQEELTEGVACVVSAQPPNKIYDTMKLYCDPIIKRIASKMSEARTEAGDKAKLMISDCLLFVTIFIQNVQPYYEPGQENQAVKYCSELLPVLSAVSENFINFTPILERCCRCWRFMVLSYRTAVLPILPIIAQQLATGFENSRQGCFLWATNSVLREFAEGADYVDPNTSQAIYTFFEQQALAFLRVMNDLPPEDLPDVIEDFFRLLLDALIYYSQQLISAPICGPILSAAISALSLQQLESLTTTLHFLRDFISYGSKNPNASTFGPRPAEISPHIRQNVLSLVMQSGEALTQRILTGMMFTFPRDCLQDASGLMVGLFEILPIETASWVDSTVNMLPAGTLKSGEKQRLMNSIGEKLGSGTANDVRKVRVLLQDFTNSYRRRNVAPREGLGRLEATRFRFSG